MKSIPVCSSRTQEPGCLLQILQRAPRMADFRMASSRVGAEGGAALARALCAGQHLPALNPEALRNRTHHQHSLPFVRLL